VCRRAIGLALELHEHVVPDLDHLRVVVVHQLAAGLLRLLFGVRTSTWISVQGPQGPVSPISQKLSFG
jgi:hypothetical protein